MNCKNIILSIAGSDPSGGAGIQADIRTSAMLGLYPCSVVTTLTAQNTSRVMNVWNVPDEILRDQLESVLADITPDAVKIGLLSSSSQVDIIAEIAIKYQLKNIVLDPVITLSLSATGHNKEMIISMVDKLFPLAPLVTPNLKEKDIIEKAAERELEEICTSFLLKGGHGDSEEVCIDTLYIRDFKEKKHKVNANGKVLHFKHPRVNSSNTHGTGCVLSTAVACFLARGFDLEEAVERAIDFTHDAISRSSRFKLGKGSYGPALC